MNFYKKLAPFEKALLVIILGLHLLAATADRYAFPNSWFVRDDAYYYFKVAQNITSGYGSTFDGINLANGYHPLWMLICIPIFTLAQFDLILPLRVLLMVIAIIHAATAIMIYRLIKEHLSHATAILAAGFWSFNSYIHATVYEMGLETPIAAFSVVLVIYTLSKFEKNWRTQPTTPKTMAMLGLVSALAMFSRLDLVFFAVLVGLWVVFRGTTIRFFAPLDTAIFLVSMTSAVILRTGFNDYNLHYASSAIEAAILAIIFKVLALYFLGAYQPAQAASFSKMLLRIAAALGLGSLLTTTVYITLIQFGIEKNFPRSAFILDFGLSLLLIFTSRLVAFWFTNPNKYHTEPSPLAQLSNNWKTWLTDGMAFYGTFGGLLMLYMGYNQITFGTSTPVSGQIKRWWGSFGRTAYEPPASTWKGFLGIGESAFETGRPFTDLFWKLSETLRPYIPGANMEDERFLATVSIAVLLFVLIIFTNKKRTQQVFINLGFIPLSAGSLIHTLSYSASAYGGAKEWYWVTQMILLTFVSAMLIDFLLKPLRRTQYINAILILSAGGYVLYSANNLLQFINYAMPHGKYTSDDLPYMEAIAFIEENTRPGDLIGMTGGGNVGYFIQDRTIVNMDGLINSPEYFKTLQAGQAPTYLYNQGVNILFANPRLMKLPPYLGQFEPYLERYNSYGEKDLLYLLPEPKFPVP